MKKGELECAELLAEVHHVHLELMKINLLDVFVFIILLSDEGHENRFLHRTHMGKLINASPSSQKVLIKIFKLALFLFMRVH